MAKIDVVIATYGRPGPLRRALAGLEGQSFRDFAVLIIDDASPEPVGLGLAPDLLERLNARVIRLDRNGGPARARNFGVQQCNAELICFIDDDVVPDPALLQRHLAAYEAGSWKTIQFGPLKAPPDWHPTAWNLWEAETLAVEYERMQRGDYAPSWRQFFTGNAFLPRVLFQTADGFNEEFTRAEDIELAYRLANLGCDFRFVANAIGWHYAKRSLGSWRTIAREYARFDVAIDELHPEMGWLLQRRRESATRNRLTRLGTFALGALSSETVGVSLAITAARLAHQAKLRRLTMPLLSFAYSVESERSLRRELKSRSKTSLGPESGTSAEAQTAD